MAHSSGCQVDAGFCQKALVLSQEDLSVGLLKCLHILATGSPIGSDLREPGGCSNVFDGLVLASSFPQSLLVMHTCPIHEAGDVHLQWLGALLEAQIGLGQTGGRVGAS